MCLRLRWRYSMTSTGSAYRYLRPGPIWKAYFWHSTSVLVVVFSATSSLILCDTCICFAMPEGFGIHGRAQGLRVSDGSHSVGRPPPFPWHKTCMLIQTHCKRFSSHALTTTATPPTSPRVYESHFKHEEELLDKHLYAAVSPTG